MHEVGQQRKKKINPPKESKKREKQKGETKDLQILQERHKSAMKD